MSQVRDCVAARCGSSPYLKFDNYSPIECPVAQRLEQQTRPRRVVGANLIWETDFFPSLRFS